MAEILTAASGDVTVLSLVIVGGLAILGDGAAAVALAARRKE